MSELLKVESTCPIHLKHEQLRPKPSDASASVSTHKTTCFLFQRRPVTTNISFPTEWALFYASKRLLSCGPREDLACRLIISKSTWFITAFVRPRPCERPSQTPPWVSAGCASYRQHSQPEALDTKDTSIRAIMLLQLSRLKPSVFRSLSGGRRRQKVILHVLHIFPIG